MYNPQTAKETAEQLRDNIQAAKVVRVSTLGGNDSASIILSISLDDKTTWCNQIFENSLHMRFHILQSGAIEQFSKSYKIAKKFRKCRAKTVEQAIEKINSYINLIR